MPIREWVRLDIGLLDDDRFEELTTEQRSAWTVAYLLIARAGDAVKDRDRLARLLTKQGIDDSARLVAELDEKGWIVEATRATGITLRGYEHAQPLYRGPSDSPEAKAARNAQRPTTRAGRRGASVEHVERHSTDSTDSTVRGATSARSTQPTSLKDELRKAGLDPRFDPGVARLDGQKEG